MAKTHKVENQPHPLQDYNLYLEDAALRDAVAREGAAWAEDELVEEFSALEQPGTRRPCRARGKILYSESGGSRALLSDHHDSRGHPGLASTAGYRSAMVRPLLCPLRRLAHGAGLVVLPGFREE